MCVCVPIVMDSKDVGEVELKIEATKNEFIKKLDDIMHMIKASAMVKKKIEICGNIQFEIKTIMEMNDAFTENLQNFERFEYRSKLLGMYGKFQSISQFAEALEHTFGISGMKEIDLQIFNIVKSISSKSESESIKIHGMVQAEVGLAEKIHHISIEKNFTDIISAVCSEIVKLNNEIRSIIYART